MACWTRGPKPAPLIHGIRKVGYLFCDPKLINVWVEGDSVYFSSLSLSLSCIFSIDKPKSMKRTKKAGLGCKLLWILFRVQKWIQIYSYHHSFIMGWSLFLAHQPNPKLNPSPLSHPDCDDVTLFYFISIFPSNQSHPTLWKWISRFPPAPEQN